MLVSLRDSAPFNDVAPVFGRPWNFVPSNVEPFNHLGDLLYIHFSDPPIARGLVFLL